MAEWIWNYAFGLYVTGGAGGSHWRKPGCWPWSARVFTGATRRRRRHRDRMSTIHFTQTTTATPEQYIAGLTDFGPGRSKLFGNSADEQLEVHSASAHHADVTEGSGSVWERLDYDWSDPHRVLAKTTDSNAWGGDSGHTYTFVRRPNGTTEIDYVVVRDGKNLKGRFLGVVLGTVGKRVLAKAFANSVKAIETRSSATPAERV